MQQQNLPNRQNVMNQQPLMMDPPQVITTKDLLYLKDHMSWQLDAMKKCAHFAQECTDLDVKHVINRAGQMHEKHYQMILQHCQNNNTQQMAQIPKQ